MTWPTDRDTELLSIAIGPPADRLEVREVGDEITVYDPATRQVRILNRTAADLWHLADGIRSLAEIQDPSLDGVVHRFVTYVNRQALRE